MRRGRDWRDSADAALVRAIAKGDSGALDALFRRHHARVHQLCRRLLGSSDAADDAVQDVFLRVARHAHRFSDRAIYTSWQYRIARNASLDLLSARGRAARRDAAWLRDRPQETGTPATPDDRLRILERALVKLSPRDREALFLARTLERPYAEIARVLGCSTGAARVRVHRALGRLRDTYREMEAQPCSATEPPKP